MRALVIAIFDDEIKRIFTEKPTLLSMLMKHERKQNCIDNICKQIAISEKSAKRHLMDLKNFEKFVRDICRIFCSTCIEHKKEEILSSLAKQGKLNEINRIASLQDKWNSYEAEALDTGIKIYPTVGITKK